MTPSHREATITARDVAERLGAELHGDGDRPIEGVGSLAHAGPHDLAFLADSKRARDAEGTKAGALLVPADAELSTDAVLLKVKNPRVAFAQAVAARLLQMMEKEKMVFLQEHRSCFIFGFPQTAVRISRILC